MRSAKTRRKASSVADSGADAIVAACFDGSAMASSRLNIMDLPDDLLVHIFGMAHQRQYLCKRYGAGRPAALSTAGTPKDL